MPRCFLHIRQGRQFRFDHDGWNFPDTGAAIEAARLAARELWPTLASNADDELTLLVGDFDR